MDNLDAGTIAVWLQVPLRVALDRAGAEGPTRPLLDVSDSLVEAETLLRRREPFYRKAQLTIDSTTADPQGLAEQIYYLVNEKGWASSHLPPPYK
jgi:shikimate kinase